jgi:hypothetical protein
MAGVRSCARRGPTLIGYSTRLAAVEGTNTRSPRIAVHEWDTEPTARNELPLNEVLHDINQCTDTFIRDLSILESQHDVLGLPVWRAGLVDP